MTESNWRRSRAAALVRLGGLVALGWAGTAAADPRDDLAAQEKALDGYGLAAEGVTPPKGVDPTAWRASIPKDNEPTAVRVALGRKLFFDKRLSKDGSVACATCHDATRGFSDGRMGAEGIGGQVGRRNSPTVANAALFHSQFWDGRSPTLEEQAKLPILNKIEMGQATPADTVAAIANDPDYQAHFKAAYGGTVNYDDLARALASFQRTLIFLDAPFDRFSAGDPTAMSPEAQAGWVLFNGKARCVSCHAINDSNPLGTDNRFHNIGVAARAKDFESLARQAIALLSKDNSIEEIDRLALETDLSELGRFLVSKNYSDIGAFKSSQLRNVSLSGPYMHDGSLATLWDVMDHYNKGGEANPFLDGGIEPLALSEAEIDQLVAFMEALTDVRFAEQSKKVMAEQRARAAEQRPIRDNDLAMRKGLQTFPFADRVFGAQKEE